MRRRLAVAATRAWTRLYTAGLPVPIRDGRRDELAADIHDHLADLDARTAGPSRATAEILYRLVRGAPDDIIWTLTTMEEIMPRPRAHTLAVGGWAYAVVVAVLGLVGAVAGLAEGWRELPQHWWSVLAAAGVAVALVGLLVAVTTGRRGHTN